MSLAKYDPKLSSHFALSLDKYTHFTSPIRRYADLVVHRCIKELISQNINSLSSKRKFIKSNSFPYSLNAVSDIAGLQSLYTNADGASSSAKKIDATSSDVVSTSNSTITISNHGFVDDEQVFYDVGKNSDDEAAAVIGGLVNCRSYFIHSATTNTF